MKWRIYYDDGTTRDSSEGVPEGEACYGVIGVLQRRGDGKIKFTHGRDYYILINEGDSSWVPADWVGVMDYLVHRRGRLHGFLVGRAVPDKIFIKIHGQAREDAEGETLD